MTHANTDKELLDIAASVLETEAKALVLAKQTLGAAFLAAAKMIFAARGHCIVSGIGKSGHIGRKIAATLSSTGTPSFFIHPTEASHGDLGMIGTGACVLAISNSGETRELRDLVVHCAAREIPLIAMTQNPQSFLAAKSDVVLVLPNAPEACPNGLAPTTSTTLTLAMGDALAVSIMHMRGFSREDFGQRHPGGTLGLQLQKVGTYLLESTEPLPCIKKNAKGSQIIEAITEGRQGCVAVTGSSGEFVGMITDGDLRRAMKDDFFSKTAANIMSKNPATAEPSQRMSELIEIMMEKRISNMFVIEKTKPIGLIHIKDLMQKGYL